MRDLPTWVAQEYRARTAEERLRIAEYQRDLLWTVVSDAVETLVRNDDREADVAAIIQRFKTALFEAKV